MAADSLLQVIIHLQECHFLFADTSKREKILSENVPKEKLKKIYGYMHQLTGIKSRPG